MIIVTMTWLKFVNIKWSGEKRPAVKAVFVCVSDNKIMAKCGPTDTF